MKIGFDAKWYTDGPPSGRRVVRQLVEGLQAACVTDELHLMVDARGGSAGNGATMTHAMQRHAVWARNNQLSNVFVVPRVADARGLDAVVYQNFVPPRVFARHARVAFVYDVIFESHPQFFTRRERLYFAPLRSLTRSADRVCTGSSTERARLLQYGYATADQIDIVPLAVDARFFVARDGDARDRASELRERQLPATFVLFVGRITARKNVAGLVRAMAHVATRGLSLVIAGGADGTEEDIATVAAAAGVAGRVHCLGAVSEGELVALYRAATLFCFPSLDEGFGLPPLEAMASGTPVLVHTTPALAETCGDAAAYVNATDPQALAAAIDALVADPARCAQLRAAGFVRASQFTVERSARALLASVHAAVAGRA